MKLLSAYEFLSKKYDLFMSGVPYVEWAEFTVEMFNKHMRKKTALILDLACGTGNMTELLNAKGYELIGVDVSEEMLAVAKEKLPGVLFINQDMTELELYGTVDAGICFCDGINYLLSEEDVLKTLLNVHNYLNPNGVFIFDINTEHKFRDVLAANTYAETFDDSAYIWENNYDEDEKINEYQTNIFIKEGKSYRRYEEFHYERAYTAAELEGIISAAGFAILEMRDAESFEACHAKSERIIFVIQRK